MRGSSHAAGYVHGIEWDRGDEDILEPTAGWSGNRGAKLKEDAFGRLYVHDDDRTEASDPADPAVLVARSAERSGYRGGRPFFGADDKLRLRAGQFEYDGPQFGGIVLGLAGLAVLYELLKGK